MQGGISMRSKDGKCPMPWCPHHLMALTDDYVKTFLLNRIIFQSRYGEDVTEHLRHMIDEGSLTVDEAQLEDQAGWVCQSATWYQKKVVPLTSVSAISHKLKEMADSGLLEARVSDKAGVPVAYRPRMTVIKTRLAELGYTLEGYYLDELKEGYGEYLANPPKPAFELTPDEAWDKIPGAPKPVKPVKEKPTTPGQPTELDWVGKQRLLDHADPTIKHASWLVFCETGHQPDQHRKLWLTEVIQLYKAAMSNETLLVEGLRKGEQAKREKGMTLPSPKSYGSFIKDVVASHNKNKGLSSEGKLVAGKSATTKEKIVIGGNRRKEYA